MITYDEVAELLAFCAVHDKRKGDDTDVRAWLAIGEDHRWTFASAFRVAREHYGAGADRPRLEPAAITDRIKTIRGQAAESFELPRIPDHVSDGEYPAWMRGLLAAHVDAAVEAWAHTGAAPPRALPAAPVEVGSLAELVARAPVQVRRELAAGAKRIDARRVRLDPDRRAAAHAELDRERGRDAG